MIKTIFFDFDGVILDSMPMREYGFQKIFENYPKDKVQKLIEYHNENGGLSRFNKINYFFETILQQHINQQTIDKYAFEFSTIMKKELTNKKYIFDDTHNFLKENFEKFNLHIVSGSEEKELQYLCKKLELDIYFKSINGSPIEKKSLVHNILKEYNYLNKECILIGDSINDYDAAKKNDIRFYGYNNPSLLNCSSFYIKDFKDLPKHLGKIQ